MRRTAALALSAIVLALVAGRIVSRPDEGAEARSVVGVFAAETHGVEHEPIELARDAAALDGARTNGVARERAFDSAETELASRIELRARCADGETAERVELCALGWSVALRGLERPATALERPHAAWSLLPIRAFERGDGLESRTWVDRSALEYGELRVVALDDRGRISAPVILRANTPSPCELVLERGAVLEARVALADGDAVAGVDVHLVGDDEACRGLAASARTDANGHARFEGLCAGRFGLACEADGRSAKASVAIETPGARREVALTVFARGIVRAVEGRIVASEELEAGFDDLRLSIDGQAPFPIRVRADGRFEHWAERGEVIELAVGSRAFGPRYEPAFVRAPFGASALVIRARKGPSARRVELRAVDARSGEPLSAIALVAPLDGDLRHRASIEIDGSASIDVPRDDAFTLELFREGYRDVERRVTPSELAGTSALVVRMEPGFARAFRVTHIQDGGASAPVDHAQAWMDGRVCSRIDDQGRVVVELAQWPVWIDFRAPGFLETTWRPAAPGGALADRDVRMIAR